jgi:putative oxidoreductase
VRWLTRLIPRLALSWIFIESGYHSLTNPEGPAKRAEQELGDLPVQPPVPMDVIARVQGGVQVAGGALLAAGVVPRLAAGALAATLIPVTYVGHPFWKVEDPQQQRNQRIHFLKNLGLFGGLLFVALDEG